MTAKKEKTVDIADFDTGVASDKGFRFELKHPTNDKGLGVFITVLGKHSQLYREHIRDVTNERLRREAAMERRGEKTEVPTVEQAEQRALELLVLCTVTWENMTYKGELLPFNTANALKVYSEQLWVRSQVDNAIDDLENFIKG